MSDPRVKKREEAASRKPAALAGLLARIIVGAVLIVSAAMKLSAPKEEFSLVIEAYGLVGPSAALTMATFLPWVELAIGYSLIFGYFLRWVAVFAGMLFVAFDFALLSLKARGILLPSCGCFGSSFHPKPELMIGVDFVLMILCLVVFKIYPLFSLDHWALRREEKNHGE